MSERDWDDVADLVVDYINKKAANRNALRREYANLLSDNKWVNRSFSGLIDIIVAVIPECEDKYSNGRDSFTDYMSRAVADIVDGHFASSVLSNNDLADDLDDRTFDEMRESARIYESVLRASGKGGRDRSDRGGRNGRSTHSSRGRDNDRDRDDRSRIRSTGRDAPRSRRASEEPIADAWSMLHDNAPTAKVREEREEPRERVRVVEPEYTPPTPPPVESFTPSEVEGPNYTHTRPADDFWIGTKHYQAAHLSKWELSGDGDNPITKTPSFVDINQRVRYVVRDESNHVTEELEELNDDNRYLQHDLSDRPVDTGRKTAAVSLLAIAARANGLPEDTTLTKEEQIRRVFPLAGMVRKLEMPTEIKFNIETGAIGCVFASRAKLSAAKAVDAEIEQSVDFHITRTPLVATSWNQLEYIEQIHKSTTLTQAMEILNELKPVIDASIWGVLNRRFSDLIMRTVRYQFQLPGLKTFNFANDWLKLLSWFENKRGASEAAEFARRAVYVVTAACQHVDRDELPSMADDLWVNPNADGDFVPAVIFIDFMVLANFDKDIDQLGIGGQLAERPTGVALNGVDNEDLLNAMRAFYRKVSGLLPPPARVTVYLTTSDNRTVEVIPFACRTDNFIMAAAD